MIRNSVAALLAVAALTTACDGKPESAATPADTTSSAPVATPDRATARDSAAAGDSAAKPAADSSTTKAGTKATAPKQEAGDYDKAIRPRFKVDEKTGKIDTIKRP
jgi:hypothetical protein